MAVLKVVTAQLSVTAAAAQYARLGQPRIEHAQRSRFPLRHLADLRARSGLSTGQLIYAGRAGGWLVVPLGAWLSDHVLLESRVRRP